MEDKILDLAKSVFESSPPKVGDFDYFLCFANMVFESGVGRNQVGDSVISKMADMLVINSFSDKIRSLHKSIIKNQLSRAFWIVEQSYDFSQTTYVKQEEVEEKNSIIDNTETNNFNNNLSMLDKKLELDEDFAERLGLSKEFLKELGHE